VKGFMIVLVVGLLSALVSDAADPNLPSAGKDGNQFVSPQQKESLRVRNIMDWAAKEHPSQKELLARIYEPVINGNKQDYPRNQRSSQLYMDRANDAAKNNQDKVAKALHQTAQAYFDLSQQNLKVLKALDAGDGPALDAAFAQMRKLELQILTLTEHPVKREWFMPGDFGNAPATAAATGTAAGTGTRPASAPAKPATPPKKN